MVPGAGAAQHVWCSWDCRTQLSNTRVPTSVVLGCDRASVYSAQNAVLVFECEAHLDKDEELAELSFVTEVTEATGLQTAHRTAVGDSRHPGSRSRLPPLPQQQDLLPCATAHHCRYPVPQPTTTTTTTSTTTAGTTSSIRGTTSPAVLLFMWLLREAE